MEKPQLHSAIDRTKASTCFWSNLAMPGVGTLHVGLKVGWAQVIVAVIGFVLTNYFGIWFLLHVVRTKGATLIEIMDTGRLPREFIQPVIVGSIGVCLFGFAFVWALVTSLMVRAEANRNSP